MITPQRHKGRIYVVHLQHRLTLADLITARLALHQMITDDGNTNDCIVIVHLDHVYLPGFVFSQLRALWNATNGFSIPHRIIVADSKTVRMTIELIQEMYPQFARHTYFCDSVEAAFIRAEVIALSKPTDAKR